MKANGGVQISPKGLSYIHPLQGREEWWIPYPSHTGPVLAASGGEGAEQAIRGKTLAKVEMGWAGMGWRLGWLVWLKNKPSDFTIFFWDPIYTRWRNFQNSHFDQNIFQMGLKPPTSII